MVPGGRREEEGEGGRWTDTQALSPGTELHQQNTEHLLSFTMRKAIAGPSVKEERSKMK